MTSTATYKKQLATVIIMLIVTLVAASGATYAWFAVNSTISADGISITAETEGINFEITATTTPGFIDSSGRVIIGSDGNPITEESALPDGYVVGANAFSSLVPIFHSGNVTASSSFATLSMYPTHPEIITGASYSNASETTTATWIHGMSDSYDDATVNYEGTHTLAGITYDNTTGAMKVTSGNNIGNYALKTSFYVRLNPDTTHSSVLLNNIIAKDVTISGSSSMAGAVYLLVAGNNSASEITTSAVMVNGPTGASTQSSVLINQITPTVGEFYKIDIYAFFDGIDEDCKSSNIDANSLIISLNIVGETANV